MRAHIDYLVVLLDVIIWRLISYCGYYIHWYVVPKFVIFELYLGNECTCLIYLGSLENKFCFYVIFVEYGMKRVYVQWSIYVADSCTCWMKKIIKNHDYDGLKLS